MLAKRIIPCLDCDLSVPMGRVVKGVKFKNLIYAGDPPTLAKRYSEEGADEIVFLDVTASLERRETMIDVIERTSEEVFIPLTVGGGIKEISDIRKILNAGADKITINTSAVKNPQLVDKASAKFGSQCIVIAIDAKRNYVKKRSNDKIIIKTPEGLCWYEVYIYGGRKPTGIDALQWAKEVERRGAGEILLTSMDRDGTKVGFELILTKTVSTMLGIPVIASGGCGNPQHIYEAFAKGKADAALAASIFHFNEYKIKSIKQFLNKKGIAVRL